MWSAASIPGEEKRQMPWPGGSGGARGAWADEASAFITSQGNPKKEVVDSSSLKELRADAIFTLWSLGGHRERFGWESGGCQREHVSGEEMGLPRSG